MSEAPGRVLHPPSEAGRTAAREVARRLTEITGRHHEPVSLRPGVVAGAGDVLLRPSGGRPPLLPGRGSGPVALLRGEVRWHFLDPLGRLPGDLPEGTVVAAPPGEGVWLLRDAHPHLRVVEDGRSPLPDETPRLVAGAGPGHLPGVPMPLPAFLPLPAFGAWLGEFPGGVPEGVEDGDLERCLRVEGALREGALEDGGERAVFALATMRMPILLRLRARVLEAGREPRVLDADLPVEGALQFARNFGRHLATSR